MKTASSILICLLSATSVRAQSAASLIEKMLPPEVVLPNSAALGLDGSQRNRLNSGIASIQAEMRPLQGKMHATEGELIALLAAPKPDEAAVLAKYAELDALEGKVKVLRLRQTLLAKSVLTAEQQAKAFALKSAQPTLPGDGERVRDKLQRVRDGIARWKAEGKDTARVVAAWNEFQRNAERRWHQQAMRSLDEALALLESNTP